MGKRVAAGAQADGPNAGDGDDPGGDAGERHIDDVAATFRALANPARLEILRQVRKPRTLAEIRLRPSRNDKQSSERLVNRVTVREHLNQLLSIGVVRKVMRPRQGQDATHYVLDHRQLFALTEELRELASLRPEVDVGLMEGTRPRMPGEVAGVGGPHLILVHGSREGQAYALAPKGEWTIGRGPDCQVQLDYDPYVSTENTRITAERGAYSIVDLPQSRNGTRLNWSPLSKGRPVRLVPGDVIGVGRSTLVFRVPPAPGPA